MTWAPDPNPQSILSMLGLRPPAVSSLDFWVLSPASMTLSKHRPVLELSVGCRHSWSPALSPCHAFVRPTPHLPGTLWPHSLILTLPKASAVVTLRRHLWFPHSLPRPVCIPSLFSQQVFIECFRVLGAILVPEDRVQQETVGSPPALVPCMKRCCVRGRDPSVSP